MIVAGVDPGIKGGIAILQDGCAPGLYRMPVVRGEKRDQYDLHRLRALLVVAEHVFIEKLGAMPGFGVTGNFSFGRAGAVVEGVCAGALIPYELVHPKTWQKAMLEGVPGDDTKQRSVLSATRLYPMTRLVPDGCRKPCDAWADALLIATWGQRRLRGGRCAA